MRSFSTGSRLGHVILLALVIVSFGYGFFYQFIAMNSEDPVSGSFYFIYNIVVALGFDDVDRTIGRADLDATLDGSMRLGDEHPRHAGVLVVAGHPRPTADPHEGVGAGVFDLALFEDDQLGAHLELVGERQVRGVQREREGPMGAVFFVAIDE